MFGSGSKEIVVLVQLHMVSILDDTTGRNFSLLTSLSVDESCVDEPPSNRNNYEDYDSNTHCPENIPRAWLRLPRYATNGSSNHTTFGWRRMDLHFKGGRVFFVIRGDGAQWPWWTCARLDMIPHCGILGNVLECPIEFMPIVILLYALLHVGDWYSKCCLDNPIGQAYAHVSVVDAVIK